MIHPTEFDIGRRVLYVGNSYEPGRVEAGVITSFNDSYVFVRYGEEIHSKATRREHLDWEQPL